MDSGTLYLRRRHTVYFNAAAVDLEETHQQIDHRGLSGTGRPDDCHLLPGLHMGGKVLDDNSLGMVGIGKTHMFKLHLSPDCLGSVLFARLVGQLFLLQEVEDSVSRRCRRLHISHALSKCAERRRKEPHIHDKADNNTKTDLSVQRQRRADHADRNIAEITNDIHQRLHHTRQKLALPVCLVHRLIHFGEILLDQLVRAGYPNHIMPGIHLLDIAVELSKALLPCDEMLLRSGDNDSHDTEAQNRYQHCRCCHPPFRCKHHDQTADKLNDRRHHTR